jgi:hypothetical protein
VGTTGPVKINWSRITGRESNKNNRSKGTEKPRHVLQKSLCVFVPVMDGPPLYLSGKTRWLSMTCQRTHHHFLIPSSN